MAEVAAAESKEVESAMEGLLDKNPEIPRNFFLQQHTGFVVESL